MYSSEIQHKDKHNEQLQEASNINNTANDIYNCSNATCSPVKNKGVPAK